MDLTAILAASVLAGTSTGFIMLATLYPLARIVLVALVIATVIETSPLLIAPALSKHRKRSRVKVWLDEEVR